jgi:hypothetical protein
LAPYLFLLIAETLNATAKATMSTGTLHDIQFPNHDKCQLLLSFADDTTFTLERVEFYLCNLVQLLRSFAQASGLYINWEKSIAYWFTPDPTPPWLAIFDFPWAIEHSLSKLLGTPFGLNLVIEDVDNFLLGKITKKIDYWVNVHLSLAAKAIIVNSILLSTLWYFISIWRGSLQILRWIRSMLRDFEAEHKCVGVTVVHIAKLVGSIL